MSDTCRQCGSYWYYFNPICRRCGYNEETMKKEFVRNPYNYDSDELSEQTGLKCPEPTLTQQQFIQEQDINYIAERFLRTGQLPIVPNMPTPGDFEGIFDFQTAMNTIATAKQEFMRLPAKVRSRFDNDPAKLLEFLNDDENRKEAEFLGLVQPKETENAPGPQSPPANGTQAPARATGTEQNKSSDAAQQSPGPKAP